MKNKHRKHQAVAILGLSVILVTGHSMVSGAQGGYNANPYLFSARGGRVLHKIENRLYTPNFSAWKNPAQGIPIGTVITTEGNSTVVLEYSWPSDLPGTLCISHVVMNNLGQMAKWFSYRVKRYDTPSQCEVTNDANLKEIERKLTQQEMAVVRFTFYGPQGGKPDSVFTPPQISQSRSRASRFWNTVRSLGWGWWK